MKTRFIDVNDLAAFVHDFGAERFMRELAETIQEDFLRWEDFDKSARVSRYSAEGVIELMPISDLNRYGFKYVNGHPPNTARDLFTVMAFGLLADLHTGYPLLLSELTLTTALRTAATSAMAARALARSNSRRMAIIGNGAQSEFQALAFHAIVGINEIHAYDIDVSATEKLIANLSHIPGLRVLRAASVEDALRGADIVTTITASKGHVAVLTPEMIEPGMHLNAVGGDCPGKTELHVDIVRNAKVFIEYEPQTRVEGEIQQLPADSPITALWKVLAGQEIGRENTRQVTLFDSVGFALEDFSALSYLYVLAQRHNIGREVDLVPPTDQQPKDLFRLVKGGRRAAAIRRVA